jgi:hypothetical protein
MSGRDNALEKTQEDILRERAMVLARAGDSVQRALEKLKKIEAVIEERLELYQEAVAGTNRYASFGSGEPLFRSFEELCNDIDSRIREYNKTREHAKLRYYYLIVTREAMGFRRHKTVEEIYKIPSKKEYMKRREWINSLNRE